MVPYQPTKPSRRQFSIGKLLLIVILFSLALACFVVSPPFVHSHERNPEYLWVSWLGFGFLGSAVGGFWKHNGILTGILVGIGLGVIYGFVIIGQFLAAAIALILGLMILFGVLTR